MTSGFEKRLLLMLARRSAWFEGAGCVVQASDCGADGLVFKCGLLCSRRAWGERLRLGAQGRAALKNQNLWDGLGVNCGARARLRNCCSPRALGANDCGLVLQAAPRLKNGCEICCRPCVLGASDCSAAPKNQNLWDGLGVNCGTLGAAAKHLCSRLLLGGGATECSS